MEKVRIDYEIVDEDDVRITVTDTSYDMRGSGICSPSQLAGYFIDHVSPTTDNDGSMILHLLPLRDKLSELLLEP